MSVSNSSNMNLPIPNVGTEAGPDYATDINNCLTLVDQHNHTPGYGVQVPSAGIDINADLTFQEYNATTLRSTRFTAQLTPIALASDIGCAYVSGADLWYNDTAGNQIQLTAGGVVNATSSGISSGTASAAFSGGVLVVKSTSTSGADIKLKSAVLTNSGNLTNTLTLQAPTLSSSLVQTLPTTPAATNFMTMDSSGNMAVTIPTSLGIDTGNIAAGAVTRPKLAAVGQQTSSTCGSFQTNSGSYVNVTNLSVTITTTGRPVMLLLTSDSTGNGGSLGNNNTSVSAIGTISVNRTGTSTSSNIAVLDWINLSLIYPPPGVICIDPVGAGTYTYQIKAKTSNTGIYTNVTSCILIAYEM